MFGHDHYGDLGVWTTLLGGPRCHHGGAPGVQVLPWWGPRCLDITVGGTEVSRCHCGGAPGVQVSPQVVPGVWVSP